MTAEQREKIKAMRMAGSGYKKIASELKLSRDTVRAYCLKNNLAGYGIYLKCVRDENSITKNSC